MSVCTSLGARCWDRVGRKVRTHKEAFESQSSSFIIRSEAALSPPPPRSPVFSTFRLQTVCTHKYRPFRINYSIILFLHVGADWFVPLWSVVSVSDVTSPAVARTGQMAALWRHGGGLVSGTALTSLRSAQLNAGGAEVSLREGGGVTLLS